MAINKEEIGRTCLLILKWWVVAFVGIWLGNYLCSKFGITSELLMILAVTLFLSIIIEIARSHEQGHNFYLRWFIFYFLVYTWVIWAMNNYLLPKINSPNNIIYFVIVGLTISIAIFIAKKIPLKSRAIPWISLLLIVLLLAANLTYLQDMGLGKFIPAFKTQADSNLSEDKQSCPTPSSHPIYRANIDSNLGALLKSLIDSNIWRIESEFGICYKGKYKNQNPNWLYCDNLIASRWDLGSSGTINYRWYTAVTAEWEPVTEGTDIYSLRDFVCENGQKVSVEKGVTNYYVYDSRDGTQIRIAY